MNNQERSALLPYLMLLVEADEPEAVLGALRRVAELRARSVRRGRIELREAVRWEALAEALARVQDEGRRRAAAE